jgi:hypothetical protein
MEPEHRIIVDTGDGAAIAFLLHPEEALSFVCHLYDEIPKLRNFALRVGAHLGPLRVVRGMNGHPNIVGDGINAAQRVMGFADINEVLVSRAFHEAVIWLSSGNAILFSPHGKQADKHGREHDLLRMGPQPTPAIPNVQTAGAAPPKADAPPTEKSSGFAIKAGLGAIMALVAGIGLWAVLSNMGSGQTAPTTQQQAPAFAPIAPKDSPTAAKQERVRPVIQGKPRSTVAVASGNVTTANEEPHNGSENCPDCSCTDLMTKLSLGIPLDEKGRRYMNERCKK